MGTQRANILSASASRAVRVYLSAVDFGFIESLGAKHGNIFSICAFLMLPFVVRWLFRCPRDFDGERSDRFDRITFSARIFFALFGERLWSGEGTGLFDQHQ